MEKVVPSVERLHRGGLAVDKTTMAFAPPAPRPLYVTGDCIMAPARPARRWPLLVVVLVAPSNALEDLAPLAPATLVEIANGEQGQLIRVGA